MKKILAVFLSWILTCPLGLAATAASSVDQKAPLFHDLNQYTEDSYLKLFRISPELQFNDAQIKTMEDYFDKAKDACQDRYKTQAKQYDNQIKALEDRLKSNPRMADDQRHLLHCQIQNLRAKKARSEVLENHAIPIAYENKKAKLELIQKWPAELDEIDREKASGAYLNEKWENFKDIGFREIAPGQKDDIKTGEDAIKQMKQSGLLPKELDDKAITDYVDAVARKVAAHSDLKVPLHVSVLNSKEVNAFALPGGFLFIERGLLQKADDESELAGVIGHEIAHDTARHAHKLMKRATIAQIVYQAAQVAAMVLTGGAIGIGTYYALQYGFYGLGMALDLSLLGVSRKYELQADQLGIEYAWNSGYDPNGFIRFFDKMATTEGYVTGLSWFRTHPPFYERMVDAERQILLLPKLSHPVVQTDVFKQMKTELAKVVKKSKKEEEDRPSLLAPEQGCGTPPPTSSEENQPIESICSEFGSNQRTTSESSPQ